MAFIIIAAHLSRGFVICQPFCEPKIEIIYAAARYLRCLKTHNTIGIRNGHVIRTIGFCCPPVPAANDAAAAAPRTRTWPQGTTSTCAVLLGHPMLTSHSLNLQNGKKIPPIALRWLAHNYNHSARRPPPTRGLSPWGIVFKPSAPSQVVANYPWFLYCLKAPKGGFLGEIKNRV